MSKDSKRQKIRNTWEAISRHTSRKPSLPVHIDGDTVRPNSNQRGKSTPKGSSNSAVQPSDSEDASPGPGPVASNLAAGSGSRYSSKFRDRTSRKRLHTPPATSPVFSISAENVILNNCNVTTTGSMHHHNGYTMQHGNGTDPGGQSRTCSAPPSPHVPPVIPNPASASSAKPCINSVKEPPTLPAGRHRGRPYSHSIPSAQPSRWTSSDMAGHDDDLRAAFPSGIFLDVPHQTSVPTASSSATQLSTDTSSEQFPHHPLLSLDKPLPPTPIHPGHASSVFPSGTNEQNLLEMLFAHYLFSHHSPWQERLAMHMCRGPLDTCIVCAELQS
ncbi:hypothetical protein B0H34DRAFT_504795 [Crassisporium funariophilum]|nr:hypothetical protein B0H34DRAFT_504795 [Crassisporium funariophilum]